MTLPSILVTDDGSPTVCDPVSGDTYHSVRGAVGESRHVFIENGWSHTVDQYDVSLRDGNPLIVLEVGFGTGLNALGTFFQAEKMRVPVHYYAIEPNPVPLETIARLDYAGKISTSGEEREILREAFVQMHAGPDEVDLEISTDFRLRKMNCGFENAVLPGAIQLVYFDAFAPQTQPELWTLSVFSRIYTNMAPCGVMVTYSSKGSVKQALREAGFHVQRLQGALGKRHMVRAVKP